MKANQSPDTRHASPVTRHPSPVTRHGIKNLIFDFGGVICNIDVQLTKQAFTDLGMKRFDTGETITKTTGLFEALEIGTLTPEDFLAGIRPFFNPPATDAEIITAWNALLLDIPEPRIRLLEALKSNYRIFLLSNSNQVHYECYVQRFREQYGCRDFDALFEKAWFSFRIGLKKPSVEIFEWVLRDGGLNPSETLFIDDTLVHVEGARKAGMEAYHLDLAKGEEITNLFSGV